MAKQYQVPGKVYVNDTTVRQHMLPGYGFINEVTVVAGGSLIKTINGLAIGSVKTVNGLAIASVKNINGLSNV